MTLVDQFKETIEKYPPEYKLIKKLMVGAFASTHEGVWNSLHLELLCLELYAVACDSVQKPKKLSNALVQALQDSHGCWGHIYQQLLNAVEKHSRQTLQEDCTQAGYFQGLHLPSDAPALEKLANLILVRISTISDELARLEPTEVTSNVVERAVRSLDANVQNAALMGAGMVDLRERLLPKLRPIAKPKHVSRAGGGFARWVLVGVVALMLGTGAYLSRDTRSASQLFEAARVEYKASNYPHAVELAQSSIAAFKSEGAEAKQIHTVRKFLSSAHYKAGNKDQAIQQMQILCKAYPDNKEYRKSLNQMKSE